MRAPGGPAFGPGAEQCLRPTGTHSSALRADLVRPSDTAVPQAWAGRVQCSWKACSEAQVTASTSRLHKHSSWRARFDTAAPESSADMTQYSWSTHLVESGTGHPLRPSRTWHSALGRTILEAGDEALPHARTHTAAMCHRLSGARAGKCARGNARRCKRRESARGGSTLRCSAGPDLGGGAFGAGMGHNAHCVVARIAHALTSLPGCRKGGGRGALRLRRVLRWPGGGGGVRPKARGGESGSDRGGVCG